MMDERDRIDIIATLHDRFNRPADEIIRKMERMEDQADKTGDEIDDLSDSLDKEARTAKDNTKALDENSKARDRNADALDDQSDALSKAARNFSANTDEVRKAVGPTEKATKATKAATEASKGLGEAVLSTTQAVVGSDDATRSANRTMDANTRTTRRARDVTAKHTKTVQKATETTERSTRATKQLRDERGRFTKATEKDASAWQKWDQRVRKIAGNAGKRFRPIGAFFQNYFKILGAFRAMLFSDIGAMIPQLITGIVAIGSAANATLAPLGRMLANLAQIAPLIAAFAQTQVVVKWAIGGVTDALKVLNDEKATLEELNAAMEEAGPNTWEMAKAVKVLGERFKPLKRLVRETFLDGLAPSVLSLVDTYFPTLEKQLGRTADIMNGELKAGIEGLQTPEKQQTIANVMERSAEASGLFVDIVFSLLDVFTELADAAGPAFLETLEAIDGKLDKFADWIRDNKSELTDFFLSANDTAGEFFRGLGGIFRGLHGISQAAQPLTDFMFGGLADRLVEWGDRMNDPTAQEEMRKGYEAMIPNLEAIGNLIGSVIEGGKEIATSEFFAPLINDLADNGIPMIVDYIKTLDETVGPPLLRISQALDEMDPDVLTSILAPLGDMLGLLATVMETVLPLFSALPEPLQKVVMYGLGLVAMGLPGLFMLLLGPVGFVLKHFEALSKIFGKLKNSKFGKAMGKVFKPIIDFAKKWGVKFLKFLKPIFTFMGKKSIAVIPVVGTLIAVLWTVWDVIKWLWDNVEPFRNFMTSVWEFVKKAWHASIDWIVNTAMPWVVDAFWAVWDAIKAVGEWLGDFYNKWIKPVIDGIIWFAKVVFVTLATIFIILMAPFKLLWDYVLKPLLGWLLDTFLVGLGQLWADIKTIAGWIVDASKWVWDKLSAGFKWLIDGLVWLWEGFVDVLKWVWNFIIDYIISPALVWFQTYMVPLIKWVIDAVVWVWNGLVDVLKWVWNFIIDYIISPALVWLKTYMWPLIKWVIDKLVGAFNWMKDKIGKAWDWIKDKIYGVYTDHIKPVFDKFGEALTALQDSFRTARDAIGKIWDGLKEKVRKPAQYVVDVVYNNGIRKIWNELAGAVNLGTTLTEVTFGSGGGGGSAGGGGGRSSGSMNTRSFDTGGYTGPGSKYQPAGIVHADEYVIRKESQRSLRREAPGFLDDLNRHGAKALGYDSGGWVKPFKGNYSQNSGYGKRGGRMHSGVDFPTPMGTALTAVSNGTIVQRGYNSAAGNKISMSTDMKGIVAGYHHLSRYAAALGQTVTKNQVIGYSGNTGRSSGPHLHFSIKKDGTYVDPNPYLRGSGSAGTGEGGGGYALPNPFTGVLDGYLKGFDKFGDNGFVDIAKAGVKTLVNKVTSFVSPFLNYVGEKAKDAGDWIMHGGDGGKNVERWKSTATAALKHTGAYSEANLRALLRRMNQESGGNPRAINNWDSNAKKGTPSMGLMQVIPPTFRTYRDKSLSTDIYDPMANIVASINYAEDRYGNLLTAYNRRGGYAKGGLVIDHMRFMGGPVETWGNTMVGELGPEIFLPASGAPASLLGLGGPEVVSFNQEGTVLPHHAVAALASINSGSSGTVVEGDTIQVDIKVGGNASDQTVHDIRQAVRAAMAEIERKKKERR